jgi:hypothetical protein
MVFNTIHGVDENDPSTVMAPFQFDRDIKLSSFRIGVDANAPKEFVDKLRELGADPKPIGARPQLSGGGGGGGGEGAAAFDFYVQMKAKELGVDIATLSTPAGRGGGGGGWWGGDRGWWGGAGGSRRPDANGIAHEPRRRLTLGAGARFYSGAAPSAYSHGPDGGIPEGLRHVHSVGHSGGCWVACDDRPSVRDRCRTSSRRPRRR